MTIVTAILDDKGTIKIPPSLLHLVKKGQIIEFTINDWGSKSLNQLYSRTVKRTKRGVQK